MSDDGEGQLKPTGECHNKLCPWRISGVVPPKVMKCSRCLCAEYCSVECQKKDYPKHKKDCKELMKVLDENREVFKMSMQYMNEIGIMSRPDKR
jgi:MYND finger